MATKRVVVFVHGWSVHDTATYGGFPERLRSEGKADGSLALDVKEILLGRYISFRDEVRVPDLAEAFEAALRREVLDGKPAGTRVALVTHSTGGPVVREWWRRYYRATGRPCPASHMIMLAPANFGSALAQLGGSRLGRVKAAIEGIQPGTGVLRWLALGSDESRAMNLDWIRSAADPWREPEPVFPFVLTGQCLDRTLYDHIVPYTGEAGGDGVVRVASANLRATHLRLVQRRSAGAGPDALTPDGPAARAPRAAFRLLPGRSHSGDATGILRSVRDDGKPHPSVTQVLRCLRVHDASSYEALRDAFDAENETVRRRERLERRKSLFGRDRFDIRDPHTMIVFRLEDEAGVVPGRFDILLVGARKGKVGPDFLPPGFFVDRQRNDHHPGTITYFVNHALMAGGDEVRGPKDEVLREAAPGLDALGIDVSADPAEGFAHYRPASLRADASVLRGLLRPDETVLVDIVLDRVVREGAFVLTRDTGPKDFRDQDPGAALP